MKALTLTQPWATLVAIGAKRVETRSWGTVYRGPLAIHAAKAFPPDAREFSEEMSRHYEALAGKPLPRGAVVATCRLVQCWRLSYQNEDAIADGLTVEVIGGGRCFEITPEEARLGNYGSGRYAWLLANVQPLPAPVSARGSLGLWEWNQ